MIKVSINSFVAIVLAATALTGCTNILVRNPAPEAVVGVAAPYGIQNTDRFIRNWGDELTLRGNGRGALDDYVRRIRNANANEVRRDGVITQDMLALSGGGPDGAFGAGLLVGWTKRGDRPKFSAVTGVSTGAIIALFAFLGPDYDQQLEEVYTKYSTDQLLETTVFSALTGGSAVTNTKGYRRLIEDYVDDEVMRRLSKADEEGRVLLVGTTNLDAARPVIWNISGIAATGHPDAERLVEDVIRASSAIPGLFPPVLIPVTDKTGQVYDEMHVDGGATQQVMLFSPGFPLSRIDKAVGAPVERSLFVVMNNKIDKPYRPVSPRLIPIASAAASSLLGGSGAGDIYKIFAIAQRDGIDLNVLAIPTDFAKEAEEAFDPVYMKELYDLGYEYGLAGDRWTDRPPGFVTD